MTDRASGRKAGPGISRGRTRSPVALRWTPLVRGSDAEWRRLFEAADAVSEGSVRCDATEDVWYGSTSVILVLPHDATPEDRELVAGVAARDLHVRLRAVRLAQREAQLRAPSTLGRCSCEIRVGSEARGVRIDVDIQAPLIEGSRRGVALKER
jgi:hypothetical protein